MRIIQGDSLEVLKTLPDESVDSIVTDPPYELGFMGKKWDNTGIAYNVNLWKECLRVLKSGGHLLAFGGTRTYHRMASAIEDAGFEVRDMIEWVYGSGFPKSLNIGKAVDKIGGQSLSWFIDYILKVADEKGISRKELTMLFPSKNGNPTGWLWNKQKTQGITLEQYHKIKEFLQLPFAGITECEREIVGTTITNKTVYQNIGGTNISGEIEITKGTSEWEGWGTALKPSHEPICMARKPLAEKTLAENCLKYGTGGINIDECRVGETGARNNGNSNGTVGSNSIGVYGKAIKQDYNMGRFPANLIHDGSEEVKECFPDTTSGSITKDIVQNNAIKFNASASGVSTARHQGDSGNASRFFKSIIYTAKASKSERNKGCEGLETSEKFTAGNYSQSPVCKDCNLTLNGTNDHSRCSGEVYYKEMESKNTKNNHPTVKPVELMEYLINMVTPKKGTVLDPFMGSGTTGVASKNLSREFVGIELDPEYYKIAESRINNTISQVRLDDLI